MASIHHGAASHWLCMMTTIMKYHAIKANTLCSGNRSRDLGSTPKYALLQPITTQWDMHS